MQIAARTAVYDPAGNLIGRIVFLADADEDSPAAQIVEARVIETAIPEFPDLQGAVIDLGGRDGEIPKVTRDGTVIAYLNGEAAHYHKNNATKHYVELCQETKTAPPEP